MKKRRTAGEVARLLRDIDRDLAKGLTIADVYRKINIAETTYYRWRQRHDPAQVNADRRCRELDVNGGGKGRRSEATRTASRSRIVLPGEASARPEEEFGRS